MATIADLDRWMAAPESENLEFKAAATSYSFDEVLKYGSAFANEGGGYLILGVSNDNPRTVVGTRAFSDLDHTKSNLVAQLRLRVEAHALNHPSGRVLVFAFPARPIGMPIQVKGAYFMRSGESLVAMTPDQLKRIFDEAVPEASAQVCVGATIDDLDHNGIQLFKSLWMRKSGNNDIDRLSGEQILRDAELITEEGVTLAAIVLFGKESAVRRFCPQAEVVFEYRSSDVSGPAQQRVEFRQGFLNILDDLWQQTNLRNDIQHVQLGLFMLDIPTFSEVVVREAILNARICLSSSVSPTA